MAAPKRITCYAVNGAGLGHVTRLMAVARWLKRYVTLLDGRAPELVFLTSTEATNVLAQNGFMAFKIPSKTLVKDNDFDKDEYRRLAKHFVWHVLGTFRPDLLVVDTFPAGSFNELFQVLDGPFRKAFIFRHVKPEFAARTVFSAAARLYDVLAVPHRPEGAPLPPSELRAPVVCCGEVVGFDPHDALDREAARSELGVPAGERLLYLSAGGGGDPGSEEALRHLVSQLGRINGLHLLVGAGPLYRGAQLGGPRVTWSTGPNVARYFHGCDGAISAAGYNTVHELLLFRVPSLLYAQPKVADDQLARIAALEEVGAALLLPNLRDGALLRRLVERLLEPEIARGLRRAAEAYIPENGAARCARAILSPFYDERQLAWAAETLAPELVRRIERLDGIANSIYGHWLPRLLPASRAGRIEAHPQFEQLLASLGDEARGEVLRWAALSPGQSERAAVERALGQYLDTVAEHPSANALLVDLIGVALKKHPLEQEPSRDWGRWVAAVLEGLAALLRLQVDGLGHEELIHVYRVFPRVADCDCGSSFALFEALVRRRAGVGQSAQSIAAQLRELKLGTQKVQRQHVLEATGGLQ